MHVLPEAQQETASTSTEEPRPNDTGSTEEVPPEVLDLMAAEKVQVLSLLALLGQKYKD